MKKLLVIIPAVERGGAEKYAQTIARACIQGWDVHAAVTETPQTLPLVEELTHDGIACHTFRLPLQHFAVLQTEHTWKHERPRERSVVRRMLRGVERTFHRLAEVQRTVSQLMRTVKLLRSVQPDVVLLNICWGTFGLGIIAGCAVVNVPTAVVFHGYPFPFAFRAAKRRVYHWARQRRQRWVTVSDFNRSLISQTFGLDKDEVVRIYNGIRLTSPSPRDDAATVREEVRAELGLSDRSIMLLTVARLELTKGFGLLVRVLPDIIRDFSHVCCVWVGEGKDKECIAREAAEHRIASNVLFLGYRSDVPRLMRAADLFVLPTEFEGLPFTILEAMAQRVPVVASDVGGIPEVIRHRVDGLIVSASDVHGWAEALQWALTHPDQMRAMAIAAEARVQQFSEDRMIRETLDVLKSLIQNHLSGKR